MRNCKSYIQRNFKMTSNLHNRKKKVPHEADQTTEVVCEDDEHHSVNEDSSSLSRSHSRHSRHKEAQNKNAKKKKLYQTRRATFALGAVIGLLITIVITAFSSDDIRSELDKLVSYDSVSDLFDDWKGSLPQSILLILDSDGTKEDGELHGSAESFSVGRRMKKMHNLTEKYNVVLVPGVISTGIESWSINDEGDCPSTHHFRKRLWGSFYMLKTMVLDKACWLKHIKLDPETGLDPPNIKLRASMGFDAADFFVAGYWIWNKVLQNLAVIGYGPNTMISAAYDWRLAYLDLEKRDGFFSKLKLTIEELKRLNGEKTYLVGHSMGSQVILYFMKWVEAEGLHYGNGGPNWCNEYLAGFINISGSLLGAPKAISALLSGEMKDTVQLNQLAVYGLEKFFSKKERVDMLRTFGGIPSMLPKGGDVIWGNRTSAPDDPTNELNTDVSGVEMSGSKDQTFGSFIKYRSRFNQSVEITGIQELEKDFTMEDSINLLLETSPEWFSNRVTEQYSFGVSKTEEELKINNHDHLKWANPLEIALPNAPDMKIYCFYGVGNPTERAYTYRDDPASGTSLVIDTESENPVFFGDGDGTLSLMTHSICHEWQKKGSRFNPSGVEVKIVEIKHEPDRFDIRGGAKTAEHVDILGSAELNELVLKVVAGRGDEIEDAYVSELHQLVQDLDI